MIVYKKWTRFREDAAGGHYTEGKIMEENLEVLTGYRVHYEVMSDKNNPDDITCYMFKGNIGFKKGTSMDEALTKIRATVEADKRTVTFYSVECSNVKKFNDEI